ncbi:nucleotide exchange factor GrpE [Lutispora saccharofermentans]|uniref:Protein GrpE n=1 Tax=Lutispora saccharofermentans TaxID=3024236 RepID=A0ABT1NKS5_9FIRM|nr:nucleotide exchange factor GrpE [Lutispora saccharofermentans]MCQ1530871.1 nucleotide exchange factor GrpE [Lutispora saccharofermentans]
MKKKQDNDLKNNDNFDMQNEEVHCEQQNEELSNENEKLKEEIKAGEDKIKECEAVIEEYKDKNLRLQADFDNYRKRVAKEREEMFFNALEDIMCQLLPIIDNFERAIDSFKAGDLDSKYVEGLNMIYKDFLMTLNKNGLEEIKALNCEFDPNRHHAVMQVEADEEDENQVKEIFQKGYMLKTKVIRPSMVKVAIKN